MGTQTTKAKSSRKKSPRRKNASLATCPVGAQGWCSFPFTAAQLEKRMKAKAEQTEPAEPELAAAGVKKSR